MTCKKPAFMKSPPLYFEFSRNTLKAFNENDGAELPLEREPDGRLTAACRQKLITALKQLQRARGWPANSPAWCAIDARGVSLRCLLLPAVAGNGLYQEVRLQIESEFPLAPDELAWGYRLQGPPQPQPDGSTKQAVLVAAVKKEIVGDYSEILSAAGFAPVFTLSSLARAALCPYPPPAYAVLELAGDQCELAGFSGDSAAFARVLPPVAPPAGDPALDALAKAVRNHCKGQKLYIFGNDEIAAQLARRLTIDLACEPLKIPGGAGRSAAIQGLKKLADEQREIPLELLVTPVAGPKKLVQPALVEWGVRALLLLLAVLLFPSLEALLLSSSLSAKVEDFRTKSGQLETTVDHELNFLRNLKQNQPPYLESFYVISKAAPQGIHLDSITMNRLGNVAIRGSMRSGDQVADFRSKLIASGFFASVVVEEQTPTPDHQKVSVHMTAQWQPLPKLQALAIGPTSAELGVATNADATPGAPPGHGPTPAPPPGTNAAPSTNGALVAAVPPGPKSTTNSLKGGTK